MPARLKIVLAKRKIDGRYRHCLFLLASEKDNVTNAALLS